MATEWRQPEVTNPVRQFWTIALSKVISAAQDSSIAELIDPYQRESSDRQDSASSIGPEYRRAFLEGRLTKRPGGFSPETFAGDYAFAQQLEGGVGFLPTAHGTLYEEGIRQLQKMQIDLTINGYGQKNEESQAKAELLSQLITNYLIGVSMSTRSSSASADALVVNRHRLSHFQCGAKGGDIQRTLGDLIQYGNNILTSRAKNMFPSIELRGGKRIAFNPDHLIDSNDPRVVMQVYDEEEYYDSLKRRGFSLGNSHSTYCVDDNHPWNLSAHVGERQVSYPHQVVFFAFTNPDSPHDNKLALTLLNTQVIRTAPPGAAGNQKDEFIVPASGGLGFHLQPDSFRKFAGGVPSLYQLVGPGAIGSVDSDNPLVWRGSDLYSMTDKSSRRNSFFGLFQRPEGYDLRRGALPNPASITNRRLMKGVVVGNNPQERKKIYLEGMSPRGPLVVTTIAFIDGLGGEASFLIMLQITKGSFYSAIAVVDTAGSGSFKFINFQDEQGLQPRPVISSPEKQDGHLPLPLYVSFSPEEWAQLQERILSPQDN